MFRQTGDARIETRDRRPLRSRSDARIMRGELAEALSVLVGPALLLSGLNLFFG